MRAPDEADSVEELADPVADYQVEQADLPDILTTGSIGASRTEEASASPEPGVGSSVSPRHRPTLSDGGQMLASESVTRRLHLSADLIADAKFYFERRMSRAVTTDEARSMLGALVDLVTMFK